MENLPVLKVLFYSVMFFVVANSVLSLFLWHLRRTKVYGLTFLFWFSNIFYLWFQFFFPQTTHEIVLVYGVGVVPMYITYRIICEIIRITPKVKPFVLITTGATVLTGVLLNQQVSFTLAALPFALALSAPLVMSIKHIFFDYRHLTSGLEKILGAILGLWIVHCFNFAFFRMEPNAPLYGWITTYALYDLLAIILPATVIVNQAKTEKERLHALVNERTSELSIALLDKENLLKILVHDISNPLTVMKWYLTSVKKAEDPTQYIDKIIKSQEIVESIVSKVKTLQTAPKSQNIVKVSLPQCVAEIKFVFEKALEQKNIKLNVIDQTNGDESFLADQFTFTHNILSNLISNAIKFSFPNSTITILMARKNDLLNLIIKDNGKGMSQELIHHLCNNTTVSSTPGTNGEVGTGYGLGITRSMLTHFKGEMQIASKEFLNNGEEHGTTITISLPFAN